MYPVAYPNDAPRPRREAFLLVRVDFSYPFFVGVHAIRALGDMRQHVAEGEREGHGVEQSGGIGK